tara:strand:- start:74 stop:346 length:273 start_codon:yes stop_codon:yes gene_type:complete
MFYSQFDLDHMGSSEYEEFLFYSGQISRKPLDNPTKSAIIEHMNDEDGYEYDEGSDCDNWENEQVFQDQVQEDRADQYDDDWDKDPDTPF